MAAVCNRVDRQATYTDTATEISIMEVALCLQFMAVVDRQATFTRASPTISSIVMALWLQSETVVDRRVTFTDTLTR